jgi:hypothetical protein
MVPQMKGKGISVNKTRKTFYFLIDLKLMS